MNGPWFDKFHEEHPDIPIGIREYGGEGLDWHTSEPRQGDYTEEHQAYYHEELIKQLYTRPYIWAAMTHKNIFSAIIFNYQILFRLDKRIQ